MTAKEVDRIRINVLESAMCRAHGKYTVKVFSYETFKGVWAKIKFCIGKPQLKYLVVLYSDDDVALVETDVDPKAWTKIKKRVIMNLVKYIEYLYPVTSVKPEKCLYLKT